MSEIHINNHTELPRPTLIRNLKMDDESASKSHHDLVHMFKLPKIGEYAWGFKLCSQSLRWNYNPNANSNLTLVDFIESIHLSITCPESVIAHSQNQVLSEGSFKAQETEVNFFYELPLMTSAMNQEDVYIVVKFRKQPPASYTLEYQVGFLDPIYITQIEESIVNIMTGLLKGNTYQNKILTYRGGKLYLMDV